MWEDMTKDMPTPIKGIWIELTKVWLFIWCSFSWPSGTTPSFVCCICLELMQPKKKFHWCHFSHFHLSYSMMVGTVIELLFGLSFTQLKQCEFTPSRRNCTTSKFLCGVALKKQFKGKVPFKWLWQTQAMCMAQGYTFKLYVSLSSSVVIWGQFWSTFKDGCIYYKIIEVKWCTNVMSHYDLWTVADRRVRASTPFVFFGRLFNSAVAVDFGFFHPGLTLMLW